VRLGRPGSGGARPEPATRTWNRWDTAALVAVTLLAGLVRVVNLGRPGGFVFDEFYAADGCWYFDASESMCMTGGEITVVHPPLGKWLIGLGIRIFGFTPGGWRIASAVAGTLTVAGLYLMARKLLGSTLAAFAAAGLLATDFLHVVLSRTAMLDVFVTAFGVAAFLFFAFDHEAAQRGRRRSGGWGLGRPWRFAAGLAAGAAAATKWSGWPILAAILVLTAFQEMEIRRTEGGRAVVRTLREEGASIALGLLALPVLVYLASYAGRLDGVLLAWPWSEGSWVGAFLDRQAFMLDFHLGLKGEHPYASPAWSWLALKRPVLFYFVGSEGRYREILAMGNPLVWWLSVPALVHVAASRGRAIRAARGVVLGGFAAGFAPWLLLAGAREQTFLYLILPAVPFMCLALGAVVQTLRQSRIGVAVVAAFAAATVSLFAFYYPLLTAAPLSYGSWRQRILFTWCGEQEAPQLRPQTEPGPPPAGWCWV
jgi:dolichyl-phosphate-mannose-protein mannosyltransferase